MFQFFHALGSTMFNLYSIIVFQAISHPIQYALAICLMIYVVSPPKVRGNDDDSNIE